MSRGLENAAAMKAAPRMASAAERGEQARAAMEFNPPTPQQLGDGAQGLEKR
jgi:hypothetical protein